jgi:hypothetical protein
MQSCLQFRQGHGTGSRDRIRRRLKQIRGEHSARLLRADGK